MSSSDCILVLGHDDRLLETRRLVLETAGFRVLTAGRLEDAEQLATTETIELLLLCHTLSGVERYRVISYIQAQRPKLKLLLVTTVVQGTPDGPWMTVDALAGARQMIIAARKAIAS